MLFSAFLCSFVFIRQLSINFRYHAGNWYELGTCKIFHVDNNGVLKEGSRPSSAAASASDCAVVSEEDMVKWAKKGGKPEEAPEYLKRFHAVRQQHTQHAPDSTAAIDLCQL